MLNNEDMGTEIKVSVPAGLRALGARCLRRTPLASGSPSGAAMGASSSGGLEGTVTGRGV